jgi:AbrB family looped-hinge helix DNA binding protein
MSFQSKLTSKSQVTVPKDIRAALGIGPGSKVRFHIDADGTVSITAADDARARATRKAEYLARAARVSEDFAKFDPFPGMDGLDYQRLMRGDGPEV